MKGNTMLTREAFITDKVLTVTRSARIAVGEWDADSIEAASKSLLAVASQMRKLVPAQPVPLDDSVPLDCLSDGHSGSESGDNGGGGYKVETDRPEPVRPSPVNAAELFASL